MKTKTNQQRDATTDRGRFGLVFRERFLEWQPGQRIHLHRDPMGIFKVIFGSVIAGLVMGVIFGLIPAFMIFGEEAERFFFPIYLVVSGTLGLGLAIWTGLDGRRRDSVIDWERGRFHTQVGWVTRDYSLEKVYEMSLTIEKPNPKPKDPEAEDNPSVTYAARILIHAGRKTYILLQTEFVRDDQHAMRSKLTPVIEQLAEALQVSWSER